MTLCNSKALSFGALALAASMGIQPIAMASTVGGTPILINEVDADTAGSDTLEFVELWDGGVGNTPLDGLILVFYNGSSDTSYNAFDLAGFSTNASGYFLLGNPDVLPLPDIIFPGNGLQNGADGVALYTGLVTDFPSGTPVTTTNLVDALIYDTDDGDDAGLLVLIPGGSQMNEDAGGNKDFDSIQRCPNGAGGALNTSGMGAKVATPGAECSQEALFESYCVSFPNSFSVAGATMSHSGSGGIADNDTALICNDVPNTWGIFYFGSTQAFDLPFGNGVMCVGAPVIRLQTAMGPAVPNQAMRALDFQGSTSENQILSGQTWNFQYWYRDPSQGAGFNTSDGLSITFAP
ncbi:MAG: hypothetical protein ACI8X5_002664 [Planctomycetota bacterium]|jgi:hypothetical protein